MCGFVGLINKNINPVSLPIIAEMADKIHHRGPDDEGNYLYENIGFYHKRLSIIDISSGKQPMTFDGITIVFNGEIYNYIELREALIRKGHKFVTQSDTEVIIRMYIEYGFKSLNELNGMFSFLIHDKPKNQIFVARDHFGIKPMYWYQDSSIIAFGSEIKALLAHPNIKAEKDDYSLQEYLTFQFLLGNKTLFKNIYKVTPGQYQIIDLSNYKIIQNKYWEPDFSLDPYHTEEYFIVKLRELLDEVIIQQLRSDVPLGTYLSGGIDSSLVTILSSKLHSSKIKAFTGHFAEGPEFSEFKYAKIAAEAAGAELFDVQPTAEQFIDTLPNLIYHLDEPVAGPGLFPQYMVSKLAKEHVTVVLGGQGGDEIFGGYARYIVAYLEQALKGAINETNEEAEHIVSLSTILPNLPYLKQYIPMIKGFMNKGFFQPMDRRYFYLINRMSASLPYLNKEFANSLDLEHVYNEYSNYFNESKTLSYFNKMTHFDMFGSLPGLLQVEDRVSMAVSIESRVPLLDRRIVDLISHMPAGMKFHGAEMKFLLKKTIQDIMPAQIMNRKDKMGFPVPLHLWINGKAKDFVMDIFTSTKARNRGMLNSDLIEKMISEEQPFNRGLWGLLSLELWFNSFID